MATMEEYKKERNNLCKEIWELLHKFQRKHQVSFKSIKVGTYLGPDEVKMAETVDIKFDV